MKHQKSYSFFCCYCEESRKRIPNNQINKPRQDYSQIYKIDTNSNFSEKVVPPINLNNLKIENEKEKENNNTNYILENIKSIDSYRTINNKNKNDKMPKKEENNNTRNFHKNFFQNDINSFLAKKERNNINVENLSAILKNYKNYNSVNNNNNIIQKEKPEEKEEQKKDDNTNKDKNNIENLQNLFAENNDKKNADNKTCNNKINNLNFNQSLIKVDEKENVISQTVRRVDKFELDDKISQEQLLWKNKSKNSNIVNNDSNLINKNNIIDISNNNISNKSLPNETKNEKDTNPINKIEANIDNDITCEKEKEESIPKENEMDNELSYKKSIKENKTLQQKEVAKLSLHNNNDNSFNSDFEIKANINNIEMNLINTNRKIKNEDNQNKKEISINKEETVNNQINEINNIETQKEIADKTDVFDSQSLSQNGDKKSSINIKEGINIKLNYLTEFYPTKTNQEENKETETKKSKSKKESVSEEIDDEVGSIDEFNNSNDNRSILTSYVFSSVRPTESNKSYASSVYGHSESQDLISNYNEIMSNKGMRIFPVYMNNNNKEVEIRMDNLYKNSKNYFLSMQMNQIKKLKDKITDKEKIINNNYSSIEKLKNKMENMEEEGRQYERWIEKEEEENENLVYLLNFLIGCK